MTDNKGDFACFNMTERSPFTLPFTRYTVNHYINTIDYHSVLLSFRRLCFLTFEDGYTAKIFNTCDIRKDDDVAIGCFKDLRPGEKVLARWSDNKFYKATVEYVGSDYYVDKKRDAKKDARKDTKRHDVAAHSFYYPPPLHPEIQHTLAQPPPQPPPTVQSPKHQSPFRQPHDQSHLAPPHCQPPFPQASGQPVCTASKTANTS